MASVIQDYDDQLNEIEEEIRSGIDSLAKLKGNARQEKVTFTEKRIERARQVFNSFKMEIPELAPADRRTYQARAKDHQNTLNKLLSDLSWAKTEKDREDLVAGAKPARSTDPNQMTTGQLAQAGVDTQNESLSSLERSKRTIETTEAVGRATAGKLKEQTEQLSRISDDLDKIETQLKRADRELKAFIRRMMTDKIILCFLCILACGIVAAVALTIYNKQK
eukprot:ANDGO_03108.mRNA.1 putative plant SNARE 12